MNKIGSMGEKLAAKHLKKIGYKIIERNFKLKCGEIDIIAKDGEYVCFIEVKGRTSNSFGEPFEDVDFIKQEKLRIVAEIWLNMHNLCSAKCRFDVVSIVFTQNYKVDKIEVIKDAFWE